MFSSEVTEQLKYYVYRLIDPRTGLTFYVGKGKGNRVYAHINDALKNYNGESYEAVRKYWKVNLNRIQKVPYVLASLNGVIVDVFKTEKWYAPPECPERCMFDGKQAPKQICDLFRNRRLPKHYMKKGMASPVLYHDQGYKR